MHFSALPVLAIKLTDAAALAPHDAQGLREQVSLLVAPQAAAAKRPGGHKTARLVDVAKRHHWTGAHRRALPVLAQSRGCELCAKFVGQLFRKIADAPVVVVAMRRCTQALDASARNANRSHGELHEVCGGTGEFAAG